MPKRDDIKTILVIGSGPIVIGQAAEFDYAGTQACLSLKEEGYRVVLVNSNPATIMTDAEMADKVYIEPITLDFVSRIIRKERPDAILPTLGGQTGLNMAMELSAAGILDECNVEVLGTDLTAIKKAKQGDVYTIIPEVTLTQSCLCRVQILSLREGSSGQSQTKQEKTLSLPANQPIALTKLSLNISPDDRVKIVVTVSDGQSLHLSQQWPPSSEKS